MTYCVYHSSPMPNLFTLIWCLTCTMAINVYNRVHDFGRESRKSCYGDTSDLLQPNSRCLSALIRLRCERGWLENELQHWSDVCWRRKSSNTVKAKRWGGHGTSESSLWEGGGSGSPWASLIARSFSRHRLMRSLSLCLSLSPSPCASRQSLSPGDAFKVKPFGQSDSCTAVHRRFPFLSCVFM